MTSLKLSESWDLALTEDGSLTVVTGLDRVAQDVASYERVFRGEGYYDSVSGVPYLLRELGTLPPQELVITRANDRAKQVPGVKSSETELLEFTNRVLSGRIKVRTDGGEVVTVAL